MLKKSIYTLATLCALGFAVPVFAADEAMSKSDSGEHKAAMENSGAGSDMSSDDTMKHKAKHKRHHRHARHHKHSAKPKASDTM